MTERSYPPTSHILWKKRYIAYPLPSFSNFVEPLFLLSPTPTHTALSAVLFPWLNGWSRHIWCATLLNDVMDLHMMSSLDTLVPEGPWCVIYATRHQVYWYLTRVFSLVLWYYTNTHTHTPHITLMRLIHPYKYIFATPVLCWQQLSLL